MDIIGYPTGDPYLYSIGPSECRFVHEFATGGIREEWISLIYSRRSLLQLIFKDINFDSISLDGRNPEIYYLIFTIIENIEYLEKVINYYSYFYSIAGSKGHHEYTQISGTAIILSVRFSLFNSVRTILKYDFTDKYLLARLLKWAIYLENLEMIDLAIENIKNIKNTIDNTKDLVNGYYINRTDAAEPTNIEDVILYNVISRNCMRAEKLNPIKYAIQMNKPKSAAHLRQRFPKPKKSCSIM